MQAGVQAGNFAGRGIVMGVIWNMVQGLCMAIADAVPGVSGGTIAFVMGFYDIFIESLDNIITGNKKEKQNAFLFLLKLGAGWIVGFICTVLALGKIFDNYIYELCSMFMGLSFFAVPIIIHDERQTIKGKYAHFIFAVIGVAVVALITYLNQALVRGSMDISNFTFIKGMYVFIVAAIAISAMVLPGISGSTLLLIFGLYVPIMNAIRGFLHFEFKYVPVLFVFGIGILAGIFTSVKLLRTGLEKYRSQMVFLILGLVVGSIYAIVTGPATLEIAQPVMTVQTFKAGYFILGGAILLALQFMKKCMERGNVQ